MKIDNVYIDAHRQEARKHAIEAAETKLEALAAVESIQQKHAEKPGPYVTMSAKDFARLEKNNPTVFNKLLSTDPTFSSRLKTIQLDLHDAAQEIEEAAERGAVKAALTLPEAIVDADRKNGLKAIMKGRGLTDVEMENSIWIQ